MHLEILLVPRPEVHHSCCVVLEGGICPTPLFCQLGPPPHSMDMCAHALAQHALKLQCSCQFITQPTATFSHPLMVVSGILQVPNNPVQRSLPLDKGPEECFLHLPLNPQRFNTPHTPCSMRPPALARLTDYPSFPHLLGPGRVRVITQEVMITEDGQGNKVETNVGEEKVKEIPFMHLQFELPDTPLFKDESERNIIPQVCPRFVI